MQHNKFQITHFRLTGLIFLIFWSFFAVFYFTVPQFDAAMLPVHSDHMNSMNSAAQHHEQTSRACISVCLNNTLNDQRALLSFLIPSELAGQMDPVLSLLKYDHPQLLWLFISGLFFVWFALSYLRRLLRRYHQTYFDLLSRGIIATPRSSL